MIAQSLLRKPRDAECTGSHPATGIVPLTALDCREHYQRFLDFDESPCSGGPVISGVRCGLRAGETGQRQIMMDFLR